MLLMGGITFILTPKGHSYGFCCVCVYVNLNVCCRYLKHKMWFFQFITYACAPSPNPKQRGSS